MAANGYVINKDYIDVSTHSRAEAAAMTRIIFSIVLSSFQHTAARRRLQPGDMVKLKDVEVSTHSRAEAAAYIRAF